MVRLVGVCRLRLRDVQPRHNLRAIFQPAEENATGAVFTFQTVRLLFEPTPARAMRLFGWSITYVTLLFGAMAVDQLVRSGL